LNFNSAKRLTDFPLATIFFRSSTYELYLVLTIIVNTHNLILSFLLQQREEVGEEAARKTNIFSEKGQKVLFG